MDSEGKALGSLLEPSFAHHMIRAEVMALMTLEAVGLQRGYGQAEEELQFIASGGSIKCDTAMFFPVS